VNRTAPLLAALAALLAAPAASAHEVLHSVERNRAVAVRAYFADGEVLAYAQYEVYSPADPKIPHQKGRTDRSGWLAFVPDAEGTWRVKVADATGHGLDLEVDAAAQGATASTAPPAPAPASTAAFVLRPLVGVAIIGAVFAVLFEIHRRRGTTR
jgi:nickel transport protein